MVVSWQSTTMVRNDYKHDEIKTHASRLKIFEGEGVTTYVWICVLFTLYSLKACQKYSFSCLLPPSNYKPSISQVNIVHQEKWLKFQPHNYVQFKLNCKYTKLKSYEYFSSFSIQLRNDYYLHIHNMDCSLNGIYILNVY